MLEIKSLSFSYGNHHLFKNISYAFEDKSFHCVIGMNGSGKTTFAKLLVGILSPSKGTILYKNNVLQSVNIGYLPQKLHFNELIPITVYDFVLMGRVRPNKLFFTKQDRSEIMQILEQCQLQDKKDTVMQKLSGGQVQKAIIARLLVSNPDILVLDEPFVSLDVQARQGLLEQLLQLKGKRLTFLITHDVEIIKSLTSNILCISNDTMHHDYLEYFFENQNIPVSHLCSTHS